MTEQELAGLEEKVTNVSFGRWVCREEGGGHHIDVRVSASKNREIPHVGYVEWESMVECHGSEDYPEGGLAVSKMVAEFICAAREMLPKVIEELRLCQNVIHDMMQEGEFLRGVAEGRRIERLEVCGLLEGTAGNNQKEPRWGVLLGFLNAYKSWENKDPDPIPPPERMRTEMAELRVENKKWMKEVCEISDMVYKAAVDSTNNHVIEKLNRVQAFIGDVLQNHSH